MKATALDLVREVLDHELVDSDGWPCGMADDVELQGKPGERLTVSALLVGPAVAATRLPKWAAAAYRLAAGTQRARVEWRHVVRVAERIHLDSPAHDLGLNAAGRRLGRWFTKIPGG